MTDQPAAPKPGEKVILIVDDKGTTRNILVHNLRTAGYRAIEAESGIVALNIAFHERVDMIILDVMMPKLDGYTVCERLRANEKTKDVPVVMCTAKGMKEDVVLAMRAGANDYIVKPFSKATVMEKVKKFIGDPPSSVPPPRKETVKKPAPVPPPPGPGPTGDTPPPGPGLKPE